MNYKKLLFWIMVVPLLWSAAFPGGAGLATVSAQANSPVSTITSTYATNPPVLDGLINFGEWNFTNQVPFHDGLITVVNDSTRLYVLLDVTGETTNDTADYLWVTFDVNRNAAIDANTDLNYGLPIGTRNMRYQFYLGPNSWTGASSSTYSARAIGFGCFFSDGSLILTGIFPLRYNCSQHRVWELAFDLAEIGSVPGGTAKMGVRVSANSGALLDDVPANFTGDFSNLTTINLAPSPYLSIAPLQGAHVLFPANPIEVTQAVQHPDDSLPLVANKATVARVYTSTGNVSIGETARTYLYGNVGGADLPGSPMVIVQRAPTVINRNSINDTANFLLPGSWTGANTVTFSAKAVGQLADTASTANIPLAFTARGTLTVWIVPVNTGTVGSPVLPPQSEIDRQISTMRTIYPLANITFVQKPWTVLGVVTGEPITALNTYYNDVVLGWLLTVLFTGSAPFTLPDQIYGFTPAGGGQSDPIWLGGAGHVARGFLGTSMEATMAHEINHNLDKSASGTWGRHVNPGGTGCGATGPDPSWPYADPDIHSVGFDTRLPWTTSGSRDTVIPATVPDIMSYCGSGLLPTKWISDYRWNALFSDFASLAAPQTALSAAGVVSQMYYVTGLVSQDPKTGALSGQLDPIKVQPGLANLPVPTNSPNFELEFIDNQKVSHLVPFQATFTNDPEEPANTVYFNFEIPVFTSPTGEPLPIIQVNLIALTPVLAPSATTLDTINVAPTVPTLTITSPATAGTTWSGVKTLSWSVDNTLADDSFNVLFSSDSGASWNALASNLIGVDHLDIDTTTLPNSANPNYGEFRVVMTDGFNTVQADSPTVIISNTSTVPTVHISSPLPGDTISPTGTVDLEGSGNDATDGSLPDDHLIWSEGGTTLGSGHSLEVQLPFGRHTITLEAVNSQGFTATTDITILVGNASFLPRINR